MKRSLAVVLLSVFFAAPLAASAAPSQLFFSEYVEGSSLNKALEIFNGTGSAVDLNAGSYSVQIYFNGSASAGTTIALTGTVANGDVYVVADDGADAAILAVADQTSTSNFFNGDDVIILYMGATIIDVIGQLGTDPGSEWPGGGAEDTLRRKSSVLAGDTDPTNAFSFAQEWDIYPQNTFSGLGSHSVDTVPAPATLALLGIGLAGLGLARRRKAQ